MNIGIIGCGNVGRCLGPLWGKKGHRITYGVRDPARDDVKELVARSGLGATARLVPDIPARADVILLAVRWGDVPDVIQSLGPLAGKVVIDCITPMEKGTKSLLFGFTTSAAEQIAAMTPGASVVKAFDTTGVKTMENPRYDGVSASVFVCGDDKGAKDIVRGLATGLGFEAIDAGPLRVARYLEPLAMLWVHLALVEGFGLDMGFKLLRRSTV